MKIEQIHSILNTMTSEILGKTDIVAENLSNIVDIGRELLDATSVDAYVKKLVNHIGRVKFVDRVYNISTPSILKEGWEYGSILEKIQMDLPESEANETWGLTDGLEYKQDIFKSPKISTKFYNNAITFEIDISITDKQVKQSFSNATQLNAFFSMIYNRIDTRQTVDMENLTLRTINNFSAATIYSEYGGYGNLDTKSGVRAVNLLYLYKQLLPENERASITPANCLTNLDFLKFASYTIMLYSDRMEKISTLFNISNKERFTPKSLQHIVMHSEFARSADVYLQSDTFHNEFTKLPKAEIVTYWQGTGEDYSFNSTSDIHTNILTPDGQSTVEMVCSGIICTMFDHEALGVNNERQYVTSHYNAKGEFTNNFYKTFAQFFNDYQENFVVFFVA